MSDDVKQVRLDDVDENDEIISTTDSGEDSLSGSNPDLESDDDTGKAVGDAFGEEPKAGEPFSMAEEIEKDEMKRHGSVTQEDLQGEFEE